MRKLTNQVELLEMRLCRRRHKQMIFLKTCYSDFEHLTLTMPASVVYKHFKFIEESH